METQQISINHSQNDPNPNRPLSRPPLVTMPRVWELPRPVPHAVAGAHLVAPIFRPPRWIDGL